LVREAEWSSSEDRLRGLGITPIVFGDYGEPLLDRLRQMAEIAEGVEVGPTPPPPPRPDPVRGKVETFLKATDVDRDLRDELINLGPEASPFLIAAVEEEFKRTRLEPFMTNLRTLRQKRGIHVLSKMAVQEAMDYLKRLTPPGVCFVAAGRFKMGSGEYSNEKPEHYVDLDSFWLAEYPVTYREYEPFVGDGGYAKMRFWTPAGWGAIQRAHRSQPWRWHEYEGHEDHPVQWLSWYEAVAFVRWLSERRRTAYRLPTEAEWEKAAGWDPAANRKRKYPWGDEYDPQMHPSDWAAPHGQEYRKADSPYGLAHMCGHVWQWTSSLRWPLPYDAEDGREDLETEGERVIRGSSWANRAQREFFRCTSRYDPDREVRPEMNLEPNYEGPCGLRVAIGISEQELVAQAK
jgi:formylglycine-generating enzyme required for sulfatase activity